MPPASIDRHGIAGRDGRGEQRARPPATNSTASASRTPARGRPDVGTGVGAQRGERRDLGDRPGGQPGRRDRHQHPDGEGAADPARVERGRAHVVEPEPDQRHQADAAEAARDDADQRGRDAERQRLEPDRATQLAAGDADAAQQRELAHPLGEEDREGVGDDQHRDEERDGDEEQGQDRDHVDAAGDLRPGARRSTRPADCTVASGTRSVPRPSRSRPRRPRRPTASPPKRSSVCQGT